MFDHITSAISTRSADAYHTLMGDIRKVPLIEEPELVNYQSRSSSKMSRLKSQSSQKNLSEKKKLLLKELMTVEDSLRKCQVERLKYSRKTENSSDDAAAFDRANQLITRMNQQRRQRSENQKKHNEKIHMKVQKSMKKFAEMNQAQEREKEEKRQKIEQRINQRKTKLRMRQEYNRKADHLISELQNYRVSLPTISFIKNPETERTIDNSKASLRRYPKGLFLSIIEQEQLKKRRQQHLKQYERKKVRERQQLYGRKVRKSLRESSVFVTN